MADISSMPAVAPEISVLLPTRGESPYMHGALSSLAAQTLRPAEVLVIETGDRQTPPSVLDAGRGLPIRQIEARGANLAVALNLGLRNAQYPFVARMDDDDECLPQRLAEQAAYLANHPEVFVVGTSFERIDPFGRDLGTCIQPSDPREVRWRLLVQNCVAHGSVMLRRDAVLAAGGYDGSCERAQDFDLWLRLAAGGSVIANLPQVLYRYRCDPSAKVGGEWVSSAAQGEVAARGLVRAWEALPSIDADADLAGLMAAVISGDAGAVSGIEHLLTDQGPTRERLRAYLWSKAIRGHTPTAVIEAGRAALLREVGAMLRARGVRHLWLWGAGAHTAWVLAHRNELGVHIAGIVDDRADGCVVHGFHVQHPSTLDSACDVLLSSDAHEDAIWASSTAARARGVRVHRLYAGPRGVSGAAGEAA